MHFQLEVAEAELVASRAGQLGDSSVKSAKQIVLNFKFKLEFDDCVTSHFGAGGVIIRNTLKLLWYLAED